MERMDYFLELYGSLPRGGPGDNGSTRKAYRMISGLPHRPRILDVGCGPGMQTVELLRLSGGTVVALDLLPLMIRRTREAVGAAGMIDRLETVEMDMNEISFPSDSFDLIWSEGAIYFIGFDKGLARVGEFLKPGGYIGVSEAVWLRPDPPSEALEFWRQYPEIDTVERKLEIISRLGYRTVGHFVLPPSSWTDLYYDPLEKKLPEYENRWKGIPDAEAALREARQEIEVFRKHSSFYSYAFFVMQK